MCDDEPEIDIVRLAPVVALIRKVYEFDLAGGGLHIVVDDDNIETSHIRWCLDSWIPEDRFKTSAEQKAAEIACGEALLELTEDERQAAIDEAHRQMRSERP